ncbi:hypothetical protein OAQ87_00515 [Candidatus Marinimicrobia bacterium]|nr:hypothetical protein [Candidatus Neomarinimicrobiota bacterium]
MKKILLLIIILFFSCDQIEEEFGVGEFEQNFTYFDFLAYGWSNVFENDPDLALNYFDQALNTGDVEFYNSAFVGMGWAKTYQANRLLNTDVCINNIIDCTDAVDSAREQAKCFFYYSTLYDDTDLSLKSSSQILAECNQDETIINAFDEIDIINLSSQESNAYIEYTNSCAINEQGEAEYVHCFENFIPDMQIAYLYLEYISYLKSNSNDNLLYNSIITSFELFLINNPNYDIMIDKSNYGSTYSFNYKNIASTIVKLYLMEGQYDQACSTAIDYGLCEILDCDGDILSLINCIETKNLSNF